MPHTTPRTANNFSRLVSDLRACTACERMAHSHVLGAANGPLDVRVLFVAEAAGRRGAAVTGVPLTRDQSGQRFAAFLALVDVPVVVTLGRGGLESPRAIDPHDLQLRRDVARATPWAGRTLVPMYHSGRQSTPHRPHAQQKADWRRLGVPLRHIEAAAQGAALAVPSPAQPVP